MILKKTHAGLIALCLVPNLLAIDCVALSQREAFRSANIVFLGTVTSVQDVGGTVDNTSDRVPTLHMDSTQPVVVTFKVDRGWKGPVNRTMYLLVFEYPQLGSGYMFIRNKEYVVYADAGVRQDWNKLRPFTEHAVVYGLGPCPRIKTDVRNESHKLGAGFEPQ